MPCEDCEKKNAGKVIVPDKWKAGAKNVERKINVNMLLINKDRKSKDYRNPCRICKMMTEGAYCQACAYKKGICNCCGKKILDVAMYRQSSK